MTRDEQLAAFKKAIEDDKYDQTTRLVMADWLEEHGYDDEALVQRKWTREFQVAEDWLTSYGKEVDGLELAELIKAGHSFLDKSEPHRIMEYAPRRASRDLEEFWIYFATYTGRTVTDIGAQWWNDEDDREQYHGCSGCYDQ